MAKLSKATEEALDVIAHVCMAQELDKNVKGMAGFSAFYRKQMTAKQRQIMNHLQRLSKLAYRNLAEAFERENQAKNGG